MRLCYFAATVGARARDPESCARRNLRTESRAQYAN